MNLVTNYDKGGMNKKLCSKNSGICWSLHALWDAEILKSIDKNEFFDSHDSYGTKSFNIEETSIRLHKYICQFYEFPDDFELEDYVDKFKGIALYLVEEAAKNLALILNSKFMTPRKN